MLAGVAISASCGGAANDAPAELLGCEASTRAVSRPQTIAEAVSAINAMPRPVSLDCFLARLERPLRLNATDSIISFQPAVGAASPRMFLFEGQPRPSDAPALLIMSVAVGGSGQALLELAEEVAPARTVKAEIEFPVTEPLELSDPFTRIEEQGGTSCGLCHAPEEPSALYPNAYESAGLAFPERQRVSLSFVQLQYDACLAVAPESLDARCRRLIALFDYGATEEVDFPSSFGTLFRD